MFRKQNQGFSFTHVLLVVVVIAAIILISFGIKHGSEVAAEKQSYKEADAQITSFVNDAAKLAPSTKEIKRYCSRTSEEYSEGNLSCTIDGTVEYAGLDTGAQKQVMSALDARQQKLSWKFAYDNTQSNQRYSYSNYVQSKVYRSDDLLCGIHYEYKEDNNQKPILVGDKTVLSVGIDCSGRALSEYYPVAKS